MFLKSLEIQGFKSFADKTVLTFDAGITAVVGPNGSGKSNISDAVRWVLGEQSSKTLRGSKMEDVVFNGTSHRKAVGFAEVSLVIDNRDRLLAFDADDVKVTRRYYRSGESDYLINNAAVRLKDVQLLFMDTGLGRDGYSMVGQGRIDQIVSSKSQERREIFEEAAGIAKYRYRKNEAERQLATAEDNLLRLRDILQELEERVGPLKIQSEKAKKFLTYAAEKKELEIGVWLQTIERSRTLLRELDAKHELARTQYDAAGAALEDTDRELEALEQTVREIAANIEQCRADMAALEEEAVRCDGNAELVRNDRAHNEATAARIRAEQELAQEGKQKIEETIAERQSEIEEKRAAIAAAEAEQLRLNESWEALLQSNEEVSGKIEDLNRQAAACAGELSDIRVKAVTGESSLSEITMRLSQLTAAVALQAGRRDSLAKEKEACEADLKRENETVESLQNAVKGYELRYRSRGEKREAARKEADRLGLDAEECRRRIRLLEEMERSLEGFSQSVKSVMKQAERGELRGIRGPVTRLIHTDGAYALAIETALGANAQHLVCEREEDAKRGIKFLKDTKGGRATFRPLQSLHPSKLNEKGLSEQPGFVGLASDLVTTAPEYTAVAEDLLGRIAVAEELDDAVVIARKYGYRFRIVTLDGQVVNAGGSLTGGSHVREAGLLSRRSEIERLQEEYRGLEAKAAEAKTSLKALEEETAAVEAELVGARGELTVAQEDRIRLEGECHRLQEAYDGCAAALKADTDEIEELNRRAEECHRQMAEAEAETARVQTRAAEIDRELEELSGGRQILTEQREALSEKIGEQKLAVVGFCKEIEALEQAIADWRMRLADQDDDRVRREEEIAALERKNGELDGQVALLVDQAADLRRRRGEIEQGIEARIASRAEAEARQTALRQQTRDKNDERERLGREVTRLEEKCTAAQKETDDILNRLYEEYELTRAEAEAVAKPIEDAAAANRRLTELKNKIRALGSVNTEAIEEYKEVSERYEFLNEQVRDVEVSREKLLRLIGDLTGQMKTLFIDRFRQINGYFGEVFAELFGGGKAELVLTDPEDILSSGIEMHAQPPGKVILNMDALSGGEKALVGTALLFAILKVTPSPFCILDEVEAALDDVNVDRYAQYLRRMCERTQFIVITHRRGTMEEADVLYGVTMQEQGISKLLELRASEVEARLGLNGKNP